MKIYCMLPCLLLGGAAAGRAQGSAKRPNIIVFLVDDQGWEDTSVPFYKQKTPLNERYHTPNMERLAKLGVKFTQAYACAVSSPSRCSLLSGMNAARHKVTNWTLHYDKGTDNKSRTLNLPPWHVNGVQPADKATAHDKHLSTLITALPEILRKHGYYTIHCGKAHFASETTSGANPVNFGFDINIAGGANGGPGSYLAENEYGTGSFHVNGLEKYYGTGVFLSEALTREALKAIQRPICKKQPFYLYFAHYAIHRPFDPDIRFTKRYEQPDGKGIYDPLLKTDLNKVEINHAALIEGMDKSLGDVLNFLQKHPKVAKNTILLFMSDNGGHAIYPRQGKWDFAQNYPARAGKGSPYLGGVREPMMVYWPGVTKGGSVNRNRVMIEDFFPTILELAGIRRYKTVQKVDGISFVNLLRHPSLRRSRPIIWHFPNLWDAPVNLKQGYSAYSAILKGPYHLIYFWENQELRLYNIDKDISERENLAKKRQRLALELAVQLTDSLKSYHAQRPSFKSNGKYVPWPDGEK